MRYEFSIRQSTVDAMHKPKPDRSLSHVPDEALAKSKSFKAYPIILSNSFELMKLRRFLLMIV